MRVHWLLFVLLSGCATAQVVDPGDWRLFEDQGLLVLPVRASGGPITVRLAPKDSADVVFTREVPPTDTETLLLVRLPAGRYCVLGSKICFRVVASGARYRWTLDSASKTGRHFARKAAQAAYQRDYPVVSRRHPLPKPDYFPSGLPGRSCPILDRPMPPKTSTSTSSKPPIRTKDEIGLAVEKRLMRFKRCYQSAIKTGASDLGGKIHVLFRIAPSGAVAAVRILTTTMGAPEVEECVRREVCALPFNAKPTFDLVSYPFVFGIR